MNSVTYTAEIVLRNEPLENVHLSVNEFSYVETIKDGKSSKLGTPELENLTIDVTATYRFVGRKDVIVVLGSTLLAINVKCHR